MSTTLALATLGGLAGGIIARLLRIPGGTLLGAVLGAAAVQLTLGGSESLPTWVRVGTQIAIGGVIGSNMRFDAFRGLGRVLLRTPPLLVLLFVVAGGVGVAFAAAIGAPVSIGVLSTIPGGASDMIAIALDMGDGASTVAAVHLLRLLIIYGILGSLFRVLLPPAAPAVDGDGER